ncbi:SDR family NAD(P)-dependent oxidoreductase [Enteractinococcus coprophilus]|uniref:SDR family NAD(P)-dependent oxidoreductase n=1 Tax=Enteractinococcus coprophilus TaxID=1027633 RepID=UPI001B88213D
MACPFVRISRQWGNTNTAQFQGLGLRDRDICSSVATGANQAEEDFDSTLDIDLKGVFFCLEYEIEAMFKTGGGAIINAASVAGLIADP